jgi:hypothetical protein
MGSGAAARRAGQRPKKKPTNPEKTNASATASGATAVCQPAAKATTDSLGQPRARSRHRTAGYWNIAAVSAN